MSALGAVSGDAPCQVAPLALTGASLSGAQGGSFFCYPPTRPCRWGLAWKAGLSLALLWLLWASASRRLFSRPASEVTDYEIDDRHETSIRFYFVV